MKHANSSSERNPNGILLFSILIILSSLLHIHKLVFDRNWYYSVYSYLPEWLLNARYCFSWFQRILGISVAIGVLYYQEIFRKIALAMGVFTITTVYWKHHYPAFKDHTLRVIEDMGLLHQLPVLKENLSDLAIAGIVLHATLDILFWSIVIYYFTRKNIKSLFH